ncbi:MAG TPA: hypothetical protein PKI09_04900 [Dermatophilaceae bacterium]|jgi:hypothetical protein|nr:hypothetical protein [Dermatophilaceae bacterium]HPZ68724.1 hypothetical protein [Dermatophilaceae bacterium]HQD00769.1 hypothetical protein [Dermatophilaceae bacterium]
MEDLTMVAEMHDDIALVEIEDLAEMGGVQASTLNCGGTFGTLTCPSTLGTNFCFT